MRVASGMSSSWLSSRSLSVAGHEACMAVNYWLSSLSPHSMLCKESEERAARPLGSHRYLNRWPLSFAGWCAFDSAPSDYFMMPSHGCVRLVMFSRRNTSVVASRPSMSWCAGQLITIIAMCRFFSTILESISGISIRFNWLCFPTYLLLECDRVPGHKSL